MIAASTTKRARSTVRIALSNRVRGARGVIIRICIAFYLLSVTAVGLGAAEPSLSDTDAWLQAHLPKDAETCVVCIGPANETTHVAALYHASGCTLTIETFWSYGTLGLPAQPIYRLDLAPETGRILTTDYHEQQNGQLWHTTAQINLAHVSPNDLKVTAASTTDDDSMGPIFIAPNGTTARFTFDDEEMARRVKRAFERAIALCGGKPEPF